MKKKELKALQEKDMKELEKKVSELRAKIIKVQPQLLAGKEKNLKVIRHARREIAQILGIMQQKKGEVK